MTEPRKRFLPVEEHLPALAGSGWREVARNLLETVMGLPEIRRRLQQLEARVACGENPFRALLDLMAIEIDARGVAEAIPRSGPVVMIANHPFGGPDALALAAMAIEAREDARILGNAESLALPGVERWIMPLEILGGPRAARANPGILKGALAHLCNGGLLVVFPAGAVSHWQWATARVEDPPWPLHTARLVNKAGAAVLPVRVFGRNGPLFQILGAIHPLVRSALIPRSFLAMKGRLIRARAGTSLTGRDLPRDPGEMTAALRAAVYGVSPGDGN
jgi:putative hemolysin